MNTTCLTNDALEIISFLEKQNFLSDDFSSEESLHYFERYIDDRPQLLTYDGICPLVIVIAGLWSSAKKKKNKFNQFIHTRSSSFYELCLRALIVRGVDLNVHHRHRHMSTALHWLIAWDRTAEGCDFLDMIDEYKASWFPNAVDNLSNTVLTLLVSRKYLGRSLVCEGNDQRLIEKLIQKGVDPKIKNYEGNTALHYACAKHDVAVCEYMKNNLVDYSLLLLSKNHFNQTPQDFWHLSYSEVGRKIGVVYEAAKVHEMIPESRWKEHIDYKVVV